MKIQTKKLTAYVEREKQLKTYLDNIQIDSISLNKVKELTPNLPWDMFPTESIKDIKTTPLHKILTDALTKSRRVSFTKRENQLFLDALKQKAIDSPRTVLAKLKDSVDIFKGLTPEFNEETALLDMRNLFRSESELLIKTPYDDIYTSELPSNNCFNLMPELPVELLKELLRKTEFYKVVDNEVLEINNNRPLSILTEVFVNNDDNTACLQLLQNDNFIVTYNGNSELILGIDDVIDAVQNIVSPQFVEDILEVKIKKPLEETLYKLKIANLEKELSEVKTELNLYKTQQERNKKTIDNIKRQQELVEERKMEHSAYLAEQERTERFMKACESRKLSKWREEKFKSDSEREARGEYLG